MKKKTTQLFFKALLQMLKAVWTLFLLALHVCAKLLELSASLVSKITSSLLNKK